VNAASEPSFHGERVDFAVPDSIGWLRLEVDVAPVSESDLAPYETTGGAIR